MLPRQRQDQMHPTLDLLLTSNDGSLLMMGCIERIFNHLTNPFRLSSAKFESDPLTRAAILAGGIGGKIRLGNLHEMIS